MSFAAPPGHARKGRRRDWLYAVSLLYPPPPPRRRPTTPTACPATSHGAALQLLMSAADSVLQGQSADEISRALARYWDKRDREDAMASFCEELKMTRTYCGGKRTCFTAREPTTNFAPCQEPAYGSRFWPLVSDFPSALELSSPSPVEKRGKLMAGEDILSPPVLSIKKMQSEPLGSSRGIGAASHCLRQQDLCEKLMTGSKATPAVTGGGGASTPITTAKRWNSSTKGAQRLATEQSSRKQPLAAATKPCQPPGCTRQNQLKFCARLMSGGSRAGETRKIMGTSTEATSTAAESRATTQCRPLEDEEEASAASAHENLASFSSDAPLTLPALLLASQNEPRAPSNTITPPPPPLPTRSKRMSSRSDSEDLQLVRCTSVSPQDENRSVKSPWREKTAKEYQLTKTSLRYTSASAMSPHRGRET